MALLLSLAGCAHPKPPAPPHLVSLLQKEMVGNSGWIRIHAAEALLDNGCAAPVLAAFRPEVNSSQPGYRIGVWRVMARATSGPERGGFVERIRSVMADPQAQDRISAAESLAKLNASSTRDRDILLQWLETADDATAAFPRWLLVLSSSVAERGREEAALARLLSSPDEIARLRSAFVLSRMEQLPPESLDRIRAQWAAEPTDSIARPYLLSALLLHSEDAAELGALEKAALPYLQGKPNEQLEHATLVGIRRQPGGAALLIPLLDAAEADARIGAANGLLRLQQGDTCALRKQAKNNCIGLQPPP